MNSYSIKVASLLKLKPNLPTQTCVDLATHSLDKIKLTGQDKTWTQFSTPDVGVSACLCHAVEQHTKKCKLLLEYQNYPLLRDTWRSKF